MALCTRTGKHFSECFDCAQCAEARELVERSRQADAYEDQVALVIRLRAAGAPEAEQSAARAEGRRLAAALDQARTDREDPRR